MSTGWVTGEAGDPESAYEYDAFGMLLGSHENIPNRLLYGGQQYDVETEQYYLRARYYNPVIGRFMQEDTYRGDGLNLYAYCANNPVMYYDPSGRNSDCNHATDAEKNTQQENVTEENGNQTVKDGAYRASLYSASWENGSLEEAIARFAPDSTPVYTDKGKVIYRNETTGIEIIYDKNGNYFRINDTTISGKRSYLN
ncbi:RHS repeat-associated core domain-containing protein [bacterium D16-54]|nr:RHS repeat-associated core domain-containing protein [bacterium D16-54]RKJ08076.1 RHS repeat-associated core domain-containing protein [bacterium D16-56]